MAGMLLASLRAAGCAAPAGAGASSDEARGREIAQASGREPAGAALVDMDGNAVAAIDPAAPTAPAGRLAPAVDPDTPVSSAGQITPMPDPDTPVSTGPVGSGSGGAAGGGAAGFDPGVAYPTAPAGGAGTTGFPGVASDMPLLYCGEEKNVHGEGIDLEARECLRDAYLSNRQATFRTVAYTVEGDPITYAVDVLQRDRIRVLIDSGDNFGAKGQFLYTCTAMAFTDNSGFVLQGCDPSGAGGDRAFLTEDGEVHIP